MLTPSAVSNAKAQASAYKLRDERGMYLLVKPDGARWWRFDYRRPGTGKRNTLSLGTFPDVSLRKARERRDEARRLLADGIDPGDKRKAEQAAGAETFEAIAREWFAKHSPNGHPAIPARSFDGWNWTCSRGSDRNPLRASRHPTCWPCCAGSNRAE